MSNDSRPPDSLVSASSNAAETVDEWLVMNCTQTREGRAAGRKPNCTSTSIRWMNDLADTASAGPSTSLAQAASQIHRAPDGGPPIPLPPEGNRAALVRGAVSFGPDTQYWRPGGIYLSRTESFDKALRGLIEMQMTLRKQQQRVRTSEVVAEKMAIYERQVALHRAGKAPHPGPRPTFAWVHTTPLHANTILLDITPSALWEGGRKQIMKAWLPTETVWGMLGTAAAAQVWGTYSGSVSRGDPGQLWNLLGRVTNDYHRRMEEQRKQVEAEMQARRDGEKTR